MMYADTRDMSNMSDSMDDTDTSDMSCADEYTFSNWDPIEEYPFIDATKAVLVVGSSNEEGELPGPDDY